MASDTIVAVAAVDTFVLEDTVAAAALVADTLAAAGDTPAVVEGTSAAVF